MPSRTQSTGTAVLVSVLLLVPLLLFIPPVLADASAPQVERVERGNLVMEGMPEIPERIGQTLQRYSNTRSAGMVGWLPDGNGMLISTRFGETSQVHRVDHPLGARHQLTFFDEPVGGGLVSPNPELNGFLFRRDVGGSEFFHLFFQSLATGEVKQLTEGRSVNSQALWSNEGDRFVYSTTRRTGRDWDLHIMDPKSGESVPVLEKGGFWLPSDWSPDDSKLLVFRGVSANESYPYVLDLESGDLTPLEETDEKVAYRSATFSSDGSGIFFSSDRGTEFSHLRHLDLESGEVKILTGDLPWDVGSIALSPDGSRLAYTSNEDGLGRLYLIDTQTFEQLPVPDLPAGQVFGIEWSPNGSQLGLTLFTPRTPGDVYAFNVGPEKPELVRWTSSEIGGLDANSFIAPTLVRFPTFDTVDGEPRTIPAFYYRPEGEGPFPVLINIHGGPEAQALPLFRSSTQYLLRELGVALIQPNVRGSRGYGKTYLKLDNGFLREDSVKDIGALLDWIAKQDELDADRVAVAGGSYGGYMVLASMVHFGDRLRAGVDVVGISNFVTFLENTEDYRRDLRRVEYGDERDPKMRAHLEAISPTRHAAKINKPLFIAQGLNDPRVPASESEQMVAEIRRNQGEVWYFLAKDEGHGFSKKGNRDAYEAAVMYFYERYLLGDE